MMMAHSSQTRYIGEVDGQFLHARWWLWSPILVAQTVLHFGQGEAWVEDNQDAARSFCLQRLSFAASCLSASHLRLAFLTNERQLSRSEASCCHDQCRLFLQLVFVTLSWSNTITLSYIELAEEDCFGHTCVF